MKLCLNVTESELLFAAMVSKREVSPEVAETDSVLRKVRGYERQLGEL